MELLLFLKKQYVKIRVWAKKNKALAIIFAVAVFPLICIAPFQVARLSEIAETTTDVYERLEIKTYLGGFLMIVGFLYWCMCILGIIIFWYLVYTLLLKRFIPRENAELEPTMSELFDNKEKYAKGFLIRKLSVVEDPKVVKEYTDASESENIFAKGIVMYHETGIYIFSSFYAQGIIYGNEEQNFWNCYRAVGKNRYNVKFGMNGIGFRSPVPDAKQYRTYLADKYSVPQDSICLVFIFFGGCDISRVNANESVVVAQERYFRKTIKELVHERRNFFSEKEIQNLSQKM